MTNNLSHISLAYKLTVGAMALSEANYIANQLHLPCPMPITEKAIVRKMVAPPYFSLPCLPSAMMETTNWEFHFFHGKLALVRNLTNNISEIQRYKEWAKMPAKLDQSEAYHLATQSLSAISVDVSALEHNYNKPFVDRPFFLAADGTNKVILPIFRVIWGDHHFPAVLVSIFGPTKELMGLSIDDQSFSSRTNLLLTNDVALNNIPDPPSKAMQNNDAPSKKTPK